MVGGWVDKWVGVEVGGSFLLTDKIFLFTYSTLILAQIAALNWIPMSSFSLIEKLFNEKTRK